jgi:capsular polysaccharide biosynthesis protein
MKVSTATYEARMADVFAKVRDVVRRRYKVWVAITVLVTLVGVGITMTLKPYYQGMVRLQIDPKQNPLTTRARRRPSWRPRRSKPKSR